MIRESLAVTLQRELAQDLRTSELALSRVLSHRYSQAVASHDPRALLWLRIGSLVALATPESAGHCARVRHALSDVLPMREGSAFGSAVFELPPIRRRRLYGSNELPAAWIRELETFMNRDLAEILVVPDEDINARWQAVIDEAAQSAREGRISQTAYEQIVQSAIEDSDREHRERGNAAMLLRSASVEESVLVVGAWLAQLAGDTTKPVVSRLAGWQLSWAIAGVDHNDLALDAAVSLVVATGDLSTTAIAAAATAVAEALSTPLPTVRLRVRTRPGIKRRSRAGFVFGEREIVVEADEIQARLIADDSGEQGGLVSSPYEEPADVGAISRQHAVELADRDARIAELEQARASDAATQAERIAQLDAELAEARKGRNHARK